MAAPYLSKDELKGFENYKYSSKDTSPLSNYVMHPFWDQTVKLVPRRIAPNVLTMSGFMLIVVNVFLLMFYDYDFLASSDAAPQRPPVPPWVWVVCAINQFLAHTLDGIDGKHARRTGLNGPMGELFDHGLDSWATLTMPLCIYSVFGRLDHSASPMRFFFVLWNVHLTFILSHWEKYNTGILYLPWGYDVSQLMLCCSYLLTYFKSYRVWKFTFLGFQCSTILELILHGTAFGVTVPMSLYNVYCAYQTKSLRHWNLWEALRPLFAITVLFVLTYTWALWSPIDIIEKDPRMFYTMIGTIFSNIACRLIISQMSSTRCYLMNPLVSLVAVAMACVAFTKISELFVLYALTIVVILAHIYYGVCVVKQMCDHFGLNCFSVERRPPRSDSSS